MQTITIEQSLEQRVAEWTQTYADTITENYRQYHLQTLEGNLSGKYPEYAKQQLEEIKNGTANLMWFKVYSGKKYYKIVQQQFETWEGSKYYGQYRDASVHAFVDKKTGQIYKPAGWAKPAKHVRFDMRIISERNFVHNPDNTGWAGGYLYLR
ncbi:hypothetical protein PRAG_00194 [Prochlorococcus phage P-SSM3]|uniref:Uncharacterized protein n=1 Tax=Prochlorococcus phage P-SSM3 TaxID=536453 RepID=R9S7S7_9CAUD|nr:hypothetical protein PRAG_00194 [Prochlorococcus phage P-SSM3]AGN12131.1 hypothetical protein PRAG_00194 [Prochlorococcus phage P-SSM3]